MSDARSYVPDEALVRATLDASARLGAARDHVPSRLVVTRVLARTRRARRAAPRFRLPATLRPAEPVASARRRPIAAALASLGLSPAVLAAAVVAHAAAAGVAGWWADGQRFAPAAPRAVPTTERVTYAVHAVAAPSGDPGTARELSAALAQEFGAPTFAPADARRIDTVAAILRRFPAVRVRIVAGATPSARARALDVQNMLAERGVARERAPVAAGAGDGVRVTIEPTGAARP